MVAHESELMNGDKAVSASVVSRMRREGFSQEEILAHLRSDGCSIIESIKALKEGAGMSLADAKRAIEESQTWAGTREHNRKFIDELIATLDGEEP